MDSQWAKCLRQVHPILLGVYLLSACSGRSIVLDIDAEYNDTIDHYAICAQIGNTKYDLFSIPKQTSRLLLTSQAAESDATEALVSIRAVSSDGEIRGSGKGLAKLNSDEKVARVAVSVKYFPLYYQQRSCTEPGFCPDPESTVANTSWYGAWLADAGDEGWAVGADVMPSPPYLPIRPRISYYKNGKWQSISDQMLPSGIASQSIALNAVWGSDTNHVWAVGDKGTILYWDGSQWSDISKDNLCPYGNSLFGIWGPKQDNNPLPTDACRVWVVGNSGTVSCLIEKFWDCSKIVTLKPDLPKRIAVLRKIWGSSPSDVWIVGGYAYCENADCPGYELILKRDKGIWNEIRRDEMEHVGYLTNISGINADKIWTVSDTANILEWDKGKWKEKPPQAQNLTIDFNEKGTDGKYINGFNSIWMGAQNDVWIPMYSGQILHWHKSSAAVESWTVGNTSSIKAALLALSGSDACNMLVAGAANYRGVYLPDAPIDVR